jgi:hypothetical protein
MMSSKRIALAVASALTLCATTAIAQQAAPRPSAARSPAVPAAEIETLKAQLEALQGRLAELERAQAAQAQQVAEAQKSAEAVVATSTEQQEAIDRTTDSLAQTRASIGPWVANFTWKGDLRYRNETIDQEYVSTERNRDRVRARFGFFAKINDTMRVEMQATTTEAFDARSSNQTLTNANSRKNLDIDTMYGEWSPMASTRLTFGKMRYPWIRTSSYFYDGDVNPEGIALNWQQGATGAFAAVFYTHLMERSTQADSNMAGVQAGWRGTFGDGGRYTLAAGYFDHGAVQGYPAYFDQLPAFAFGNTTTTNPAICRRGFTTCLANDYNIVDLLAEVQFNVGARPLVLFAEYGHNTEADFQNVSSNPTQNIPKGLDTAYSAGFTFGRASAPRSWEFGYLYQVVEKDALFAQWIDSDFAAGLTDGKGSAVRFAYQLARNWRFNLTYLMNETNNDVPVQVTIPGSTATRVVSDREYKRLQLDLNMTF